MKEAAKKLVDEINSLLEQSSKFVERYHKSDKIDENFYEDLLYFSTRCLYIFGSLGKNEFFNLTHNFKSYHVKVKKSQLKPIDDDLLSVRGCLKVTKRELESGLLYRISDLARAEIFSGFLDSAEYLLKEGWKDSAAVIIGGVLEDRLRQLSIQHDLPIINEKGKKLTIEPMNDNLFKKDVYNLLKKKQITSWADIRNNAAHLKYDEYSLTDVQKMYEFVLEFTS